MERHQTRSGLGFVQSPQQMHFEAHHLRNLYQVDCETALRLDRSERGDAQPMEFTTQQKETGVVLNVQLPAPNII